MKKIYIILIGLFLFSCQKKNQIAETTGSDVKERKCASDDVLKAQLAADPSLGERMKQIEAFSQRIIASGGQLKVNRNGNVEIPVAVHVLYNLPEENISDAQVQSQVTVLNEDFNMRNADSRQVPSIFSSVKADVGVTFVLQQTIRKYTNKKSWAPVDGMKYSARGGSDAVDPAHVLNVWVCNLGQNLLGYAQFPGGNPETDGIVVLYSAFGRTGTLISRFDKGRTATHEIGHWLNLRHIWGDANCGNDFVGDTPLHTTYNFGCPAFPHYNSCSDNAVEMTMNYMDYTDDPCMYMFSNGQKDRMLAVFAAGGPRATVVQ